MLLERREQTVPSLARRLRHELAQIDHRLADLLVGETPHRLRALDLEERRLRVGALFLTPALEREAKVVEASLEEQLGHAAHPFERTRGQRHRGHRKIRPQLELEGMRR